MGTDVSDVRTLVIALVNYHTTDNELHRYADVVDITEVWFLQDDFFVIVDVTSTENRDRDFLDGRVFFRWDTQDVGEHVEDGASVRWRIADEFNHHQHGFSDRAIQLGHGCSLIGSINRLIKRFMISKMSDAVELGYQTVLVRFLLVVFKTTTVAPAKSGLMRKTYVRGSMYRPSMLTGASLV